MIDSLQYITLDNGHYARIYFPVGNQAFEGIVLDEKEVMWFLFERKNEYCKINCLTGPALEFANGTRWWVKDGLFHRTDGPAIQNADGSTEYWINGVRTDIDNAAQQQDAEENLSIYGIIGMSVAALLFANAIKSPGSRPHNETIEELVHTKDRGR